jgi:NAD(P)-dependent dehydrogenase (short-subunit alcohol dehydrogenase family)
VVDAGDPRPRVPAGRFATGEEIADVCTFLVSGRAAYITRDVIVADGGFGLNQLRLGRTPRHSPPR